MATPELKRIKHQIDQAIVNFNYETLKKDQLWIELGKITELIIEYRKILGR